MPDSSSDALPAPGTPEYDAAVAKGVQLFADVHAKLDAGVSKEEIVKWLVDEHTFDPWIASQLVSAEMGEDISDVIEGSPLDDDLSSGPVTTQHPDHPMGTLGLEWAGYGPPDPSAPMRSCGTCVMYARGKCWMFEAEGSPAPVEADHVCREWEPIPAGSTLEPAADGS